jgi:hypothetical protein
MKFRLIENDCLEALRAAGDEKVHAIVTDPPYGLSDEPDIEEVLTKWLSGEDYEHRGAGFMGKTWDSFVPGPSVWREAYRVLKPGGHLLAFASPRTVDLMAVALRIAGFEIRDQIQWLYGQGFPKSHNVGMAVEAHQFKAWLDTQPECRDHLELLRVAARDSLKLAKAHPDDIGYAASAADQEGAHRNYRTSLLEAAGLLRDRVDSTGGIPSGSAQLVNSERDRSETKNAPGALNDESALYEDWGTALKPAQEPIIVARKPLEAKLLSSGKPSKKTTITVAENMLRHRVGAYNIGATRIATDESLNGGTYSEGGNPTQFAEATGMFAQGQGRMPGQFVQPSGRHAANVIVGHHDLCVPTEDFIEFGGDHRAGQEPAGERPAGFVDTGADSGSGEPNAAVHGPTTTQVYLCHPHCAVRMLDEQSGERTSGANPTTRTSPKTGGIYPDVERTGAVPAGSSTRRRQPARNATLDSRSSPASSPRP